METAALLRAYSAKPETIGEGEATYEFGDQTLPKEAQTPFRNTGDDQYYTVQTIVFLLQKLDTSHPQYVLDGKNAGVPTVARADRKALLDYLQGKSDTCAILKPLPSHPVPTSKSGSSAPGTAEPGRSDTTTTTTATTSATAPAQSGEPAAKRAHTDTAQPVSTSGSGDATAAPDAVGRTDPLLAKIMRRERVYDTRSSVLRCRGASLEKVLPILTNLRSKHREARAEATNSTSSRGYDRYQQAGRQENRGDYDVNPSKSFLPDLDGRRTTQTKEPDVPKARKKTKRTPIIIVPAGTQCLLTMYNIKRFLEKGEFTSTADLLRQNAEKPSTVIIQRKKQSETVPYKIVDNPNILTSEQWLRVVAVIVQGPAWQFKSWPETLDGHRPVDIFSKYKGFHFTYQGKPIHANIREWDVEVLTLNENQRHLDATAINSSKDTKEDHRRLPYAEASISFFLLLLFLSVFFHLSLSLSLSFSLSFSLSRDLSCLLSLSSLLLICPAHGKKCDKGNCGIPRPTASRGGKEELVSQLVGPLVRVFLSSTFTDTVEERNTILAQAVPELKAFARTKGIEFAVATMRWGVTKAHAANHEHALLCLAEVDRCLQESEGYAFVSLLAEKYGFRPFPSVIAKSEFDIILSHLDGKTLELAQNWFEIDDNAVPPTARLCSITSKLPDYGREEAPEAAAEASAQWWAIFGQLEQGLREAAHKAHAEGRLSEKRLAAYVQSVTEDETRAALDPRVTEKYMPQAGLTNVQPFSVKGWGPGKGLDVNQAPHSEYLHSFRDAFINKMKESINEVAERKRKHAADPLFTETAGHHGFCRERVSTFQGRHALIETASAYFAQASNGQLNPLIIHGISGSGKSSVVASAAAKFAAQKSPQHTLVLRFLGTSSESTTLLPLLRSIILQIRAAYDVQDASAIAQEPAELILQFKEALQLASPAAPLVLVLDSLDQLLPDNGARKVPALNSEDIQALITGGLEAGNRTLTSEQHQTLRSAIAKCPTPLYTRLALNVASAWHSQTPLEQCTLPADVPGMIESLFEQLEQIHGTTVISHALGYLTQAYRGLSDNEMEDILSCDDDVLNAVFEYWYPPQRRFPPLLWTRIRSALGPYLVTKGSGSGQVLGWHHRQFFEAAARRYLGGKQSIRLASHLADFFSGRWCEEEKPFSSTPLQQQRFQLPVQGAALRYVANQPVAFVNPDDGSCLVKPRPTSTPVEHSFLPNIRKLEELPRQLIAADRLPDVMEQCFFHFPFVYHSVAALGKSALLTLVQAASDAAGRPGARLEEQQKTALSKLLLSLRVSPYDERELAFQLLGRLRLSANSSPYIKKLLEEARALTAEVDARARIVTPVCCLYPPDPMKINVLTHPGGVHGFAMSHDGSTLITGCDNRTVQLWNADNGERLTILENFDWMVRAVAFSRDDKYFIAMPWSGRYVIYETKGFNQVARGEIGEHCHTVWPNPSNDTFFAGSDMGFLVEIGCDGNIVRRSPIVADDLDEQCRLDMSRNGELFLLSDRRNKVCLLDHSWERVITTFDGALGAFAYSSAGTVVALSDGDKTVSLCTKDQGLLWETTLDEHIWCMTGTIDRVAVGTLRGQAVVLHAEGGEILHSIKAHTDSIEFIRLWGNLLYTSSMDNAVRGFDLQFANEKADKFDNCKAFTSCVCLLLASRPTDSGHTEEHAPATWKKSMPAMKPSTLPTTHEITVVSIALMCASMCATLSALIGLPSLSISIFSNASSLVPPRFYFKLALCLFNMSPAMLNPFPRKKKRTESYSVNFDGMLAFTVYNEDRKPDVRAVRVRQEAGEPVVDCLFEGSDFETYRWPDGRQLRDGVLMVGA
ncbi:uncharacterized protein MONBRDRAFT_33730 [Monosiga brevicollis MX1]|uniref:Uncharacterized protein n=1 Tax=Monosiga brevicollis TaxID=81824 RepID=A9V746_MONBE|nr:uncharacterized protein MONBRDRAFT_33730 [Monosiga brevicollis MX1]EDQ86656.1 predicted protein [Monosiga brevicollis MX1]|eukprot:XP_001748492.1 hypothetical protein [Monosiga brevicollis MX1]